MILRRWLAFALEFELAADILNNAVTPTWSDIEKLPAIAALRTAPNYFLEREMRAETALIQRAAEQELKRNDAHQSRQDSEQERRELSNGLSAQSIPWHLYRRIIRPLPASLGKRCRNLVTTLR